MPQVRQLARRIIANAAGLAVVAAVSTVTVAIESSPSYAAGCSGYVALTFDDGPSASNTLNLLAALKTARVRATLFNIGQNAEQNPELVRAEKAAGMWIGNHTWTHPDMTTLSTADMISEIAQTQRTIRQLSGTTPRLFRPPYGATNATLQSVEARFGLKEILWDIDSVDWSGVSTEAIVQAASGLTDGQIILMHDWPPNTVAAIPQIVSGLRSRNLCAGMISPITGRAVAPLARR